MAAVSNALLTYSLNTNREDLADAIFNVSPHTTPFISMIGETVATNTNHEWSIDTLASPAANAQFEGDTTTRAASTVPTRPRNICQISEKNATVSGTQAAMNTAGLSDMMTYQLMKRGKELKTDIEFAVTRNQALVAGGTTTARNTRGLESWLTTNTDFSTSTAAGAAGADSTAETNGRTDGTSTRTLTEAILKEVIKSCYDNGGEPSVLMVGSWNKQLVSAFTGRSQARQMIGEEKIQAAASLYASDFGDFKVVPNRIQRGRSAFLIDPEYAKIAYVPGRKMDSFTLGITGDAVTEVLVCEYALEMSNEAAHGGIYDLNTAST